MNQHMIDRYNKGQDEFNVRINSDRIKTSGIYIIDEFFLVNKKLHESFIITLYDFLFNPKWGFAKAFWGKTTQWMKVVDGEPIDVVGEKEAEEINNDDEYWTQAKPTNGWQLSLQQMVIHPNPLQYLEQFKEVPNEK